MSWEKQQKYEGRGRLPPSTIDGVDKMRVLRGLRVRRGRQERVVSPGASSASSQNRESISRRFFVMRKTCGDGVGVIAFENNFRRTPVGEERHDRSRSLGLTAFRTFERARGPSRRDISLGVVGGSSFVQTTWRARVKIRFAGSQTRPPPGLKQTNTPRIAAAQLLRRTSGTKNTWTTLPKVCKTESFGKEPDQA
jgi:hypothetical protein